MDLELLGTLPSKFRETALRSFQSFDTLLRKAGKQDRSNWGMRAQIVRTLTKHSNPFEELLQVQTWDSLGKSNHSTKETLSLPTRKDAGPYWARTRD